MTPDQIRSRGKFALLAGLMLCGTVAVTSIYVYAERAANQHQPLLNEFGHRNPLANPPIPPGVQLLLWLIVLVFFGCGAFLIRAGLVQSATGRFGFKQKTFFVWLVILSVIVALIKSCSR